MTKPIQLAILLLAFAACQNSQPKTDAAKQAEPINFESEKAAIIQVIEAESKAFWDKDFEA